MLNRKAFLFIFITIFSVLSINAQTNTVIIDVNGLTCSLCSKAVEKKMRQLDFVQSVKMDLNSNEASVSIDFSKNPDWNLLAKSVYEAGFSIGNFRVPSCEKTSQLLQSGDCINDYAFVGANGKRENPDYYVLIGKYFMTSKVYSSWKKKQILASDPDKNLYYYY